MALTHITWFVFFAVAGYVTCNYPAPTNVKSTYLPDKGVIRVSWTDHPGHPSDSYRLLITRSSRYQWMISVSRRTYDLPYPVDYTGNTYSFVLFGYNSNLGQFSELTDSIQFRTPSSSSMPDDVKVSYTGSRAVEVSWMAASSSNVKQYVVVYRNNTVFKETVPAASTSLVIRSLTYNTTYRIHVYAVLNGGTFGALSEEHPFIPVIDDESTINTTQMIPISDSTEKEYNIRLVDGGERWRGRLEVLHLGQWGTVCDDGFGSKEALAVCRQLGYNSSQKEPVAYNSAYFGKGRGPIFLDDVNCPPESSYAHFRQCSSKGWGTHNCRHSEDVSVNCYQDSEPNAVIHAEFIRLQSGDHPWMGRLEMYHAGRWGTVCGDGFSAAEALGVCNQLGLQISERDPVVYTGSSGQNRPIWLDGVTCPRKYPHLILRQCNSSAWGEHDCVHNQDVSVNCLPDNSTGIQEVRQLRLIDGGKPWRGRLEVYHYGQWGTVCDDGFGNNEALTVCRHLGYNLSLSNPEAYPNAIYGRGSGVIWLKNVDCPDNSDHLQQCTSDPWGTINCQHRDDVSVNCFQEEEGYNIRLVSGGKPWRGRLEVFHGGIWGTVCSDYFGTSEAIATCNQLGYNIFHGNPEAYPYAVYGRGSGQIWLDNVACPDHADNLQQCTSRGWGVHNCHHGKDVSVNCVQEEENVTIRLADGGYPWRGRLEVYKGGVWGTVCSDGFYTKQAKSVCNQLGYNTSYRDPEAYPRAVYGAGSGPIWLDNVRCPNVADNPYLTQCTSRGWGVHDCHHGKDVSVNCVQEEENVTIRLADGGYPWRGRLEVYKGGLWGTVCSDGFHTKEAISVCNLLGYNTSHREPKLHKSPLYGIGSGLIWLDNITCPDNVSHIDFRQCTPKRWGVTNCNHNKDVSIICLKDSSTENEEEFSIRLAHGGHPSRGRLEVYHAGQWGTVCQDGFYTNEAISVCYQLGYRTFLSTPRAYHGARYGAGSGPIWLSNVDCPDRSTNTLLRNCTLKPWGSHSCPHSRDVSVNCYQVEPTTPIISQSPPDAVLGHSVILTCNTSDYLYLNTYDWKVNGSAIYSSHKYFRNGSELLIHSLDLSDRTNKYSCVGREYNGLISDPAYHSFDIRYEPLITRAEYNVNGGGSHIVREGTSIQVNEYDHLLLTMETNANSAASVKLFKVQSKTEGINTTLLNVVYNQIQCQQTGIYTFEATNRYIVRPLRRQFSVNVHCTPREHSPEPRRDFVKKLDEIVTLSATVISNPAPTVTWNRNVQTIPVVKYNEYTYRVSGRVKINGKHDYGVYAATVKNAEGESIIEFHINPDDELSITRAEYSVNGGGRNILQVGTSIQVNENDDLLLTMGSDAIPAASLKLYKEQNEIASSNTTLLTVTYHQVQCQQTGKYTFEAIHQFNIDRPLRRQFTVDVHCMPREHNIKSTREFVRKPEETVTLSEIVISYPEPNVTWSRHVKAISVAKYNEYTYRFSGNVHITGEKDYGVYVATVENGKGELRIEYLIRPHENSHLNMVLIIVSTTSGLVISACVFTIICVCKRRKGRPARRNYRDNQYDFCLANRNFEQGIASGSGIRMDE